jgi:inner membrane protein
MATTYTHAVVGLGLAQLYNPGRLRGLYWGLAALLAVFPDFDAFSSAAYGAILGHRGFTHTLVFSLWLAFLAASLTYRPFRANIWALAGVFLLALASHGLLDALTWGGMPIPFFWPLTDRRFGNWGPIPVSDLAFEIPDPLQSRALRSELWWVWLPTGVFILLVALFRLVRRHRLANRFNPTTETNPHA